MSRLLLVILYGIFSNSLFGDFLKIETSYLKINVCVKFCFLLGKTAVETVTMLN